MDSLAPFLIGGLSGSMATLIIHPIDNIKVSIQLLSEKLGIEGNSKKKIRFSQIFTSIKNQGYKSFYRGIDSAIFRQLVYASTRLGVYNFMIDRYQKQQIEISNTKKVALSMISGAMGAIVGTPFDVVLVRRQASILSQKNIYKNTFHAFYKILRDQGITTLWKGLNITILRVIMINVGQLASHDIIKQYLKKISYLNKHKKIQNFCSALAASLFTAAISLPADNIKTKIQKSMKSDKTYTGIFDCFAKTITREGPTRLWVGFPVYLMRGTPHSFILISTQQYLRSLYKSVMPQ